ncbi:hypothetical protein KEM54_005195 [Ascosphaera aggregata]|nr:hypothetical protein KEM54_005195 [Ascosphaera aggregata]
MGDWLLARRFNPMDWPRSSPDGVGEYGKLILQLQDKLLDSSELSDTQINYDDFESSIDNVTVSDENTSRTLITVHGKHRVVSGKHNNWLPFSVRFYLYAGSSSIRIMHSIIFDGDHDNDFIRGLVIQFEVPLKGEELYDRHIRLPGVDDGYLHEAVHGITGLRRDPGQKVRMAQFEGKKLPDKETWDKRATTRLKWVPIWNDSKLKQLSPDGEAYKEGTRLGEIPGGTRSDGLAYLGGATKGGLALGLRDFWKRYPNGFEITNAGEDKDKLTLWLYIPEATPLDLRPFHDHMGMNNYSTQLDALEITYEDYEPGLNTPYGISRSSEVSLHAFDATPSADYLATLSKHMNLSPALTADVAHIQQTRALGSYWDGQDNTTSEAKLIEEHRDLLIEFYKKQVVYRRWYGFLDYGDVMHTYDNDKHIWRMTFGGMRGGTILNCQVTCGSGNTTSTRGDLMSIDLRRPCSGTLLKSMSTITADGMVLGHVMAFSTSRTVYFYFLSGGDERVGELLDEALNSDRTFDILDDQRKPASITLGTDWPSLAAGWLIEWARHGKRWEEARMKLMNAATGIGKLRNGFLTGYGLLHFDNDSISPPPADPDNKGYINVNQLNAVFGMLEVVSEMVDYYGDDLPAGFDKAFLQYCEYYHTSAALQNATFGSSWTQNTLFQGHSRLEAYHAWRTDNATAAQKAWNDFWYSHNGLDFTPSTPWNTSIVNGSNVLISVEEAPWLSTNAAEQYGLAAIQNLHMAKKWMTLPQRVEVGIKLRTFECFPTDECSGLNRTSGAGQFKPEGLKVPTYREKQPCSSSGGFQSNEFLQAAIRILLARRYTEELYGQERWQQAFQPAGYGFSSL